MFPKTSRSSKTPHGQLGRAPLWLTQWTEAAPHLRFQLVTSDLRRLAESQSRSSRLLAVQRAFYPLVRVLLGHHSHSSATLTSELGSIIDKALSQDPDLGLQLAFVRRFARERRQNIAVGKFTTADFPLARQFLGPLLAAPTAPIVPPSIAERVYAEGRKWKIRRVLLVLPPISLEASQPHGPAGYTPPLGLGLVASHLSELGNDVQILDCHRNPDFSLKIPDYASTFDLIGFNVVLSTTRSVQTLAALVRARTERPIIVVGGPAANLNCWTGASASLDQSSAWDFAVSSSVHDNLASIVASIGESQAWPLFDGITPNPLSRAVSIRGTQPGEGGDRLEDSPDLAAWTPPRLDRRVFRDRDGYPEPGLTRSKSSMWEAHVVMSRGCNWNCAFCTERFTLSGGEVRRTPESVLSEIQSLHSAFRPLRIQFVDDNLFPQVAAPHAAVGVADAVHWAKTLLDGLIELASSGKSSLGWRGIFRLEDFFLYDSVWKAGAFTDYLARSGCRLLAFGVEHGTEVRRRRLKGASTYTNSDIVSLFHSLRASGIHTKAYFMLGGPNETAESLEQTIQFSLECGSTLAYFAIYKEFVKATSLLRRKAQRHANEAEKYLTYSQIFLRWAHQLAQVPDGTTNPNLIRQLSGGLFDNFSDGAAIEAIRAYHALSNLGFSFADLIKYGDYHTNSEVLGRVTFDSPSRYFDMVSDAYARFYLRRDFVTSYSQLLAEGY